jgi:hypothetical protein
MKKFSELEKHYISLINSTDQYGRNIKNIFDNDLVKSLMVLNKSSKEVQFKFEADLGDYIIPLIRDIQYKIVVLTNLIDYLKKEDLLITFQLYEIKVSNVRYIPQC